MYNIFGKGKVKPNSFDYSYYFYYCYYGPLWSNLTCLKLACPK